ncbi:hypothetical protein JS562_11350, partial [Agrobacterium sp. S2]|nr:hypothetical protein [Agrobacterium sp. S2]
NDAGLLDHVCAKLNRLASKGQSRQAHSLKAAGKGAACHNSLLWLAAKTSTHGRAICAMGCYAQDSKKFA